MKLTLNDVFKKYPKTRFNSALCGEIPMSEFEAIEKDLRPLMRERRIRAIYRGPRVNNLTTSKPSMTCRQDADRVLLYLC